MRLTTLIDKNDNIAGISLELNPATFLLNVAAISPETKKIGMIYTSNSYHVMERAHEFSSNIAGKSWVRSKIEGL